MNSQGAVLGNLGPGRFGGYYAEYALPQVVCVLWADCRFGDDAKLPSSPNQGFLLLSLFSLKGLVNRVAHQQHDQRERNTRRHRRTLKRSKATAEKQRKSWEREESVSDDEDQRDDDGLHGAAKKGMNVVGWWRAKLNANHGLDKEILAALHLLAGARGPCMRLAFSHPVLSQPGDSDARRRNKEGLTKLHREMRAEQKSAVMFLDDPATGRRREVHLAAVWVHPADTAGDTAGDAMGSNGADEAALTTNDEAAPTTNDDGDKADAREPQFLAFEVQPNAPAVAIVWGPPVEITSVPLGSPGVGSKGFYYGK